MVGTASATDTGPANGGVGAGAQDCAADLNGDGVGDGFDFMIMLGNWG